MRHINDLVKSLFVMASMVEARDPYTGGHLWRVSQFSRILAADAALATKVVARIALGGFLHDLGKISVPDVILNKPDRLTDDEYQIVKTHPDVGNRLLADHPLATLARPAVLSHHEMPNGRGYPQGLTGDRIPIDARIVGICDAFDAMTSHRPYRKGMSIESALQIIRENLGAQFDRDLGQRFIGLGEEGSLTHIVGHSEPGIPMQECPICGPTIVVTKTHHTGDLVYCRVCGSEAEVRREDGRLRIKPTGRKGNPAQLEPEIDHTLIDSLVQDTATHVDGEGMPAQGVFSTIWQKVAKGGP
jgi:hypothetical protein